MTADRDGIATFVEVIRRGSLAAAGRELEVPKSTVSRRLARLEGQLDVKLVHRDARKVTATPEGVRFYDAVVDAIDTLDTAVATIEDSTAAPRGTVRVTAPSDLGRMLLIPELVRFLEQYPEISLDLVLTNRFVDLVQERIDLAVRAGAVTEPNLIVRKLRPSEEAVDLTVSGRVNVDDYTAMAELVAAGQGIGLMPALHATEGERAGRLVRIFPGWTLPSTPIHLVYPTRQLPERARLLVDFLDNALRQPSATIRRIAEPGSTA